MFISKDGFRSTLSKLMNFQTYFDEFNGGKYVFLYSTGQVCINKIDILRFSIRKVRYFGTDRKLIFFSTSVLIIKSIIGYLSAKSNSFQAI